GVAVGNQLITKGYRISLEFIGENTVSREACVKAKNEFLKLIQTCGKQGLSARISFDLSHIGLAVDSELAVENLLEMAKEAHAHGLSLMTSADESRNTEHVLSVHTRVVTEYPNVGVTIQAQLYRSLEELEDLLHYPGALRLVKGVFHEPDNT